MQSRSAVWIGSTLALAVLLSLGVPGCKDEKNPAAPGTPLGPDVTIDIVGNAGASSFSPNPDTVRVGQTVSWRNMDSVIHALIDDLGPITIGTGAINPGATTVPVTMTAKGTLPYHCTIHPSMVGTLVVLS